LEASLYCEETTFHFHFGARTVRPYFSGGRVAWADSFVDTQVLIGAGSGVKVPPVAVTVTGAKTGGGGSAAAIVNTAVLWPPSVAPLGTLSVRPTVLFGPGRR
jgi:hypothetical protein